MLGWILGLVGFWRCGEKDTILQTGEEEDWVGEELLLVLAADVLFVGEYACLFLSVFWMRQKKQKGVMLFGGRGRGEGSHSYLLTTICVCLSRLFGWREEEQYRSDVYVWGQSLGRCRNRRIGLGFLDKIQTRVWEEMRVPDGWMGRGLLVEECTIPAFVSRRETESCFCILGACTTFVHGSFGMGGRGGGRVHCWQ